MVFVFSFLFCFWVTWQPNTHNLFLLIFIALLRNYTRFMYSVALTQCSFTAKPTYYRQIVERKSFVLIKSELNHIADHSCQRCRLDASPFRSITSFMLPLCSTSESFLSALVWSAARGSCRAESEAESAPLLKGVTAVQPCSDTQCWKNVLL